MSENAQKSEPTLHDLRQRMRERGLQEIEEASKPPDEKGVDDKASASPAKTPAPEATDPKVGAEEAKAQPTPYTAEEFDQLAKDPEFLAKLDMERVNSKELQKKLEAANAFFDRRAKELKQHESTMIEKETALQSTLAQATELVKKVQDQNEKYKEQYGEIPDEDPTIKAQAEKLATLTRQQNETQSLLWAQQRYQDWNTTTPQERMAVAQENPLLAELAMERDGKYLPIVAAALHIEAREKKENFDARVEREVQARVKVLVEAARKTSAIKQSGLSRAARSEPPPKVEAKPKKENEEPQTFGDSLRERMQGKLKENIKGG